MKRCLGYLPRMLWHTVGKPPGYVLKAIKDLNTEKEARACVNRRAGVAERDLALRFSNQVEQVEQWSFVFTCLLETAMLAGPGSSSSGDGLEGGDAYGLVD